jgi:hypothetical protein
MLRAIESEAGSGESNAEILRRLNDQRVAQGQAPLRIKLPELTKTKKVATTPAAPPDQMKVGGVRIPQYEQLPRAVYPKP